jgi:Tetratricopeptide repeat
MLATLAYLNVRGDSGATRTIAEDLLDRWRRVLGDTHPATLQLASMLTSVLAWLGEAEQARALGESTLARCRDTFGPDDPTTLNSATYLTSALAWLGEHDRGPHPGSGYPGTVPHDPRPRPSDDPGFGRPVVLHTARARAGRPGTLAQPGHRAASSANTGHPPPDHPGRRCRPHVRARLARRGGRGASHRRRDSRALRSGVRGRPSVHSIRSP